ncbi:hypothetical protein JB92DRAFT_3142608 [Gautieria morchelliformis]|nr:hypothetical protein JB92DRAFT_3142608 [Gautieria morchelliformis]
MTQPSAPPSLWAASPYHRASLERCDRVEDTDPSDVFDVDLLSTLPDRRAPCLSHVIDTDFFFSFFSEHRGRRRRGRFGQRIGRPHGPRRVQRVARWIPTRTMPRQPDRESVWECTVLPFHPARRHSLRSPASPRSLRCAASGICSGEGDMTLLGGKLRARREEARAAHDRSGGMQSRWSARVATSGHIAEVRNETRRAGKNRPSLVQRHPDRTRRRGPTPQMSDWFDEQVTQYLGALHLTPVERRDGLPLTPHAPPHLVRPSAVQKRIALSRSALRLCDFGEAFPVSSPPDVLHTPVTHSAPEILFPEKKKTHPFTPAVDVWSMACTLFKILGDHHVSPCVFGDGAEVRERIEAVVGVHDDGDSRALLRARLQQLVIGTSAPCVLDGEELATMVDIWMKCLRMDPGESITADMALSMLPGTWKRTEGWHNVNNEAHLLWERAFPSLSADLLCPWRYR